MIINESWRDPLITEKLTMKTRTGTITLAACALALMSTAAFAQGQAGQGAAQRPQADRMMDRDLQQDHDRMQQSARDKAQQQAKDKQAAMDQQQARDQQAAMDQQQARDQQAAKDQQQAQQKDQAMDQKQQKEMAHTPDQQIYGHALMSVEERNAYREKLRMIDSDDERGKFVAEHREEMQLRADAQGMSLDDEDIEEAE